MKTLKSVSVLMLFCITTFAQSPQKFSYQAVVRNSGGNLVTNAQVGIRLSIIQGNVNGAVAYMETFVVTTNANGLATLEVGAANPNSFAQIAWADGPYFVKSEIDVAGGTNYAITGTSQLLSVPYAIHANEVGGLRILRGTINSDGTIADGTGFTCARLAKGKYKITYTKPFSGNVSVCATAFNDESGGNVYTCTLPGAGNPNNSTDATIVIKCAPCGIEDRSFTFIIAGPAD